MSNLIDLQEQILQTNAAIAEVESALLVDTNSISLQATAASLIKRQRELEEQFLAVAEHRGDDVCSYRLLTEGSSAALESLTSSLSAFQKLFSVVFDAVKNGPRDTSKLSAESVAATSFNFGYSYAGSVGIVLTIPNEKLLLIASDVDKTIEMIFKMADCQSSEDVLEFAQGLGTAPIECMSKWASSHTDSAIGACINWHRGQEIQSRLLAELPVFERIRDIIEATSDVEVEEFEAEGLLVGANTESGTFHMILSDEATVKGKFRDAISVSQTVELPRRYKAKVRKTTTTVFSTNKKRVDYFLLRLDTLSRD